MNATASLPTSSSINTEPDTERKSRLVQNGHYILDFAKDEGVEFDGKIAVIRPELISSRPRLDQVIQAVFREYTEENFILVSDQELQELLQPRVRHRIYYDCDRHLKWLYASNPESEPREACVDFYTYKQGPLQLGRFDLRLPTVDYKINANTGVVFLLE